MIILTMTILQLLKPSKTMVMTHTSVTAGRVEKDTKSIIINNDHSAVDEAKEDSGTEKHNCNKNQGVGTLTDTQIITVLQWFWLDNGGGHDGDYGWGGGGGGVGWKTGTAGVGRCDGHGPDAGCGLGLG